MEKLPLVYINKNGDVIAIFSVVFFKFVFIKMADIDLDQSEFVDSIKQLVHEEPTWIMTR